MVALNAPHPLWLAGERTEPELAATAYRTGAQPGAFTRFSGETTQKEAAAADWLLN